MLFLGTSPSPARPRGLTKVTGSASLFALTYNILRFITLGG